MMVSIMSLMNANPIIWFIAISVLISLGFSTYSSKKVTNNLSKFRELNPNAATLILDQNNMMKTATVTVHEVNGEKFPNGAAVVGNNTQVESQYFSDKRNHGLLLKPGLNKVLLSWQCSRPGLLYKSVVKYTEPEMIEFTTAPNTTYQLYFDENNKVYQVKQVD